MKNALSNIFIAGAILLGFNVEGNCQKSKPNIIYIMTDDMGYADLSCYGRTSYSTPNLDRLAAQGMKFMNAYAAAPVCTPTRAAFMTGRYPARLSVGLLEPWVPSSRDSTLGLAAKDYAVPALLKKSGYETALIGKWHLGITTEYSPAANGFDYFFGNKTGFLDYISHKGDGRKHDLFENDKPVYPEGYMTTIISNKAIDYLKQKHEKPFFLSLQFTAPHWPWQGPADQAVPDSIPVNARTVAAMGTPEIFVAMMKSLDDEIGRIMQVLEETNLAKNTVVIFTNDNGGEKFSDMGPYARRKMSVWEGGIRVPAFVRWPGEVHASTVTEYPAITMDWSATILSIAGAKQNPAYQMDGKDLQPVLKGKVKNAQRTFYWRTYQRARQHAVHDGDWKLVADEKGEYLYNLSSDPAEKNDLKNTEPKVYERLKKKYADWEKSVLKPIELAE